MTQQAIRFPFDNSYRRLPDHFHARIHPTPVTAPGLIKLNGALFEELGLDPSAAEPEVAALLFAGNLLPDGGEPIAMAYAGHQFGNFVPQLGDGRAILIGEVVDRAGKRRDIQLKGSGQTPFSRSGDGRAALGPVLREYILAEAMHALGVPTTRALAAVTTGEPVYRETILPGAILTRVASSHIRVGTFQYFASRGDTRAVRHLADHVIARHFPEAALADSPYLALIEAVLERQAALVAAWMHVGFIHGVMNTDNMAISGETIDYGPCAFMDAYDPATVFSSIDRGGRYAYGNQPGIAQWNLARFAETLLPLIDGASDAAIQQATDLIRSFFGRYEEHWTAGMRRKLGLASSEPDDVDLIHGLLDVMKASGADFTLTFRRLCDAAADPRADSGVRDLFVDPQAYDAWSAQWRARLERDPQTPAERAERMRQTNPAVIPRNHRVEQALNAAVEQNDFGPFETILHVLARPYEDRPELAGYTEPPQEKERVLRTFCGT
ncbi:protein adenylyltransferase SelO [Thiocapsa bogorovii]|uniref:protein adenylyltransferase SelO n=1 Tax=Thiocapsa bogorovii TaxID=521689 RepID=UPI001E5A1788|nr:YdiU family protein [Thiocapsa bogorovii]UHD17735.1 YdiU family protein [Thiocapsa bogorovii]